MQLDASCNAAGFNASNGDLEGLKGTAVSKEISSMCAGSDFGRRAASAPQGQRPRWPSIVSFEQSRTGADACPQTMMCGSNIHSTSFWRRWRTPRAPARGKPSRQWGAQSGLCQSRFFYPPIAQSVVRGLVPPKSTISPRELRPTYQPDTVRLSAIESRPASSSPGTSRARPGPRPRFH
jgi:hypothetical protein